MGRLSGKGGMDAAISDAAMAVLQELSVEPTPGGHFHARITGGQLDRKVYQEVNDALTRIGGKWTSGKVKAHVFDSDPTEQIATMCHAGKMFAKNPYDFFPTPDALVSRIVRHENLLEMPPYLLDNTKVSPPINVLCVLEPSAGNGAFLRGLLDTYGCKAGEYFRALVIVAVEIDPKLVFCLQETFAGGCLSVVEGDFLTMDAATLGTFDCIPMNPPFTSEKDPQAYMTHIRHAFEFLKPGGVLVSIVPQGAQFGSTRRHQEFRAFVEQNAGAFYPVDEGAFRESGTGVRAAIVKMVKPSGSEKFREKEQR